jgi:hypothetical protein
MYTTRARESGNHDIETPPGSGGRRLPQSKLLTQRRKLVYLARGYPKVFWLHSRNHVEFERTTPLRSIIFQCAFSVISKTGRKVRISPGAPSNQSFTPLTFSHSTVPGTAFTAGQGFKSRRIFYLTSLIKLLRLWKHSHSR